MMQCPRKLKVTDLNPHLICVLCGGYYVDATTIIECLHSFCKSCIVRYLETNKYCPICDVQVHKTRPLQNIRPDNTLQTIVYKLVPGLYQNEMRCRREFYANHPEAKALVSQEARGEHSDQSRIFLPDEPVSLCLEYIGASDVQGQGTCGRRYLRCPAAVSVFHLQKLIRAKFGLAVGHRVDVFYKDDLLLENWSLMDISYIYQWKRKSPIHMTYRILESQRKRIKLSHDSAPLSEHSVSNTSCSNMGVDDKKLSLPSDINDSLVFASEAVSSSVSTITTAVSTLASDTTSVTTSPAISTITTSNATTTAITTTMQSSSSFSNSSLASSAVLPDNIKEDTVTVTAIGTTATTSTTVTPVNTIKKEESIEWKEVQLQISENGIMSVAGVDDNRLLTPLQSINVPSQNKDADSTVNNVSVEVKLSAVERPENKVPPIDSDLNSSALYNKNIVKCDSRVVSVETTNIEVPVSNTFLVSKSESVKEMDLKSESKDNNQIETSVQPVKPIVHKLLNISDKNNATFKSKTDKLEDAVRNISSRTEPSTKPESNSRFVGTPPPPPTPTPTPSQVAKDDNITKSKTPNVDQVEGTIGKFQRPLILARKHKVYPGLKPVYSAPPKDDHTKTNSVKAEPSVVCTKLTPMEVLNSHKKPQQSTVKYKTLKTPIKPWNPSIPRAAALSMKHSQSSVHSKDANTARSSESQPNPPPPKQPRFFKIRNNMPRFLGNPSSGVKPMYQVAPGSEIMSHSNSPVSLSSSASTVSACASTAVSATSSVTSTVLSSVNSTSAVMGTSVTTSTGSITTSAVTVPNSTTAAGVASTVVTILSPMTTCNSSTVTTAVSVNTTTTPSTSSSAPPNIAVQKHSKQTSGPITLMKIDPKTLSPIPVTPMVVSHVLSNPPRSTSSPQPKKLPPPFTPGSPKHANLYTNCRNAHSNLTASKSTVPRIPSPAHSGGLINPFLPSVVHSNPHLLYSAFPNPFPPTDPSNNRLLTGPSNSELIRAMTALCASGSAYHPSLPPSISMLFNPHHAHHRSLQPDRSGFKCSPNENQTTQSPPPAIQRIPPSNPSAKSINEPDAQQVASNSTIDLPSNAARPRKDITLEPSSGSIKRTQLNTPPPKKIPMEKISVQQHSQLQEPSHTVHKSKLNNCAPPAISNYIRSDNKGIKSSHHPKPKPGEKIEEVTSELLHKTEICKGSNINKTSNGSCIDDQRDKVVECKTETEKKHNKEIGESKSKEEHFIPNNNNCNKLLNKTNELSMNSNSSVVNDNTS